MPAKRPCLSLKQIHSARACKLSCSAAWRASMGDIATLVDEPVRERAEKQVPEGSPDQSCSKVGDCAIDEWRLPMNVHVMKFDHRNAVSRQGIKHAHMRKILAMLVLTDDRARDDQNFAGMLASDLAEEGFLFGGRKVVQTFNGGDHVVTFEGNVQEVRFFKACVRNSLRDGPVDRNAADINTPDFCGIKKKGLRQMAFAATKFQNLSPGHESRHASPQNPVTRTRASNAPRVGFRIKRVEV
jgi:hypothetical protein